MEPLGLREGASIEACRAKGWSITSWRWQRAALVRWLPCRASCSRWPSSSSSCRCAALPSPCIPLPSRRPPPPPPLPLFPPCGSRPYSAPIGILIRHEQELMQPDRSATSSHIQGWCHPSTPLSWTDLAEHRMSTCGTAQGLLALAAAIGMHWMPSRCSKHSRPVVPCHIPPYHGVHACPCVGPSRGRQG